MYNLEEMLHSNIKNIPLFEILKEYEDEKNRILTINDEITENTIEFCIQPIIRWNKQDNYNQSIDSAYIRKPITLYINTLGGQLYIGLALCDVIEISKTPINIVVLAYVYSMGSLMLMSGYKNTNVKRYCYPFSTGLIHGGSQYIGGSASQVEDYFEFNKKYEKKIKQYIFDHTRITPNQYKKMERVEWYMTSDDMLKVGLIDEILNEIK